MTLFIYGVTTDILVIFFFFKAFKAAVLGAVTEALGFARLIKDVRTIEKSLGRQEKIVYSSEKKVMKKLRINV